MRQRRPFKSGSQEDSPRLLVPLAIVAALEACKEQFHPNDVRRGKLHELQLRLRTLYGLKGPVFDDLSSHDEQIIEELADAPIEDDTLAVTR